ncbi:MAG TPA: hypothetical protein VF263_01405 [Longimicrobiaceae bacterium]
MEDLLPKIYNTAPYVYWRGGTATGSSRMDYFGNRAEERFTLSISGPMNASREASGSTGGVWITNRSHVTPGFDLGVSGSCGHVANLSSHHTAKSVAFIEYKGLTEVSVSEPDGHVARQEDCPPPPPSDGGGGGGNPGDGGGWMICRYLETHDSQTGQLIDSQLIGCYPV